MQPWSNPFAKDVPKIALRRSDQPDDDSGEDDTEDQVLYNTDVRDKIMGLYQRRTQEARHRASPRNLNCNSWRPTWHLDNFSVCPSAQEEAAWAVLEQADVGWRSSCNPSGHHQTEAFSGPLKEFSDEFESHHVSDETERLASNDADGLGNEGACSIDGTVEKATEEHHGELYTNHELKKGATGKRRPRFSIKGSGGILSHKFFMAKRSDVGQLSLAQKFHDLVEGETTCSSHLQDLQRQRYTSVDTQSVPVAQRFQELLQNDGFGFIQTSLPFTGKLVRKNAHPGRQLMKNHYKFSVLQEDITESLDSDEDDNVVQDLNLEIQMESYTKCDTNSKLSISEQFQDALQAAAPERNGILGCVHGSKDSIAGFAARLQQVLLEEKNLHAQFTNTFQVGLQLHGCSQCLDIKIVAKSLEAQFATCSCQILHSPYEWDGDSSKVPYNDEEPLPVVHVIFSTKINSELELEVGQCVRVCSPWQELLQVEDYGKVILCTHFSKML